MLSRDELERYAETNRALAEAAERDFMKFWLLLKKEDPTVTYELALQYAEYVIDNYGDSAALNAANLYEQLNEKQLNGGLAIMSSALDHDAIRDTVGYMVFSGESKAVNAVTGMIGRQVKSYAHQTMIDNARRDDVRFARVPVGKTCSFCLMLASRGYEYYNEESAGKGSLNAFHDRCDCQIVASSEDIEGYDPDYLYNEVYKPAYDAAKREQEMELMQLSEIEQEHGVHSEEAIEYADSIGLEYKKGKRGWETVYKRRKRGAVNTWYDKDSGRNHRSYSVDDYIGRKALSIIRESEGIN